MENLSGSDHPALLMKKCPKGNFSLKNHLHLSDGDRQPYWLLFCPNLTCPNFAIPLVNYKLDTPFSPTTVDDNLINEALPDTSIESD